MDVKSSTGCGGPSPAQVNTQHWCFLCMSVFFLGPNDKLLGIRGAPVSKHQGKQSVPPLGLGASLCVVH